jgi:cystathionine gamma-synthase
LRDNTSYVRENGKFSYLPLTTPIYQTSAYVMPDGAAFRYTREANPTVSQLNAVISKLENADSAAAFSSGMGAVTTVLLHKLRPGTSVLIHYDVFARTLKFLRDFMSLYGIKTTVAGPGTDSLLRSYNGQDVVFVESISNPTLRVQDLKRIREEIKSNSILISDSTFATPVNLKSLDAGADIVIHSGSKFISGHNDVIAGVVAGGSDFIKGLDDFRKTLGETLDPFAAYLMLRGIKTLHVRMKESGESALKISKNLKKLQGIGKVLYPGLPEHPEHEIASRMLRGFGSVVSFSIDQEDMDFEQFMRALSIITPANTLGGVNTTISHPATMSHRGLTSEERKAAGIDDSLFRLSIGLEDPSDLIEDISNAMQKATNKSGGSN